MMHITSKAMLLAVLMGFGHAEKPETLNLRQIKSGVTLADAKGPKKKHHPGPYEDAVKFKYSTEHEVEEKSQADMWKNCGEPIAYWGEGSDRTTCPCKPDASKTPILPKLEKRLELLEHSPEHKWKVNATTTPVWKGQFFINLELSTKRRDFIEKQLHEINQKHQKHKKPQIATHRWAATDHKGAARANLKEFSDEGLETYVRKMDEREKWGTIGTYLSHLRLLRRIWMNDKEGEGLYAIMEDDVTLDKDWSDKVELALKNGDIPKDWDIIRFGYWGLTRCEDAVSDSAYEGRGPLPVGDGTRKSYYNGNLGYIVRPKSIPALLAAARKQKIYDVDGVFIAENKENPTAADYGIHTYFLKHSLVKGGTGGQYLGTDRLGALATPYN